MYKYKRNGFTLVELMAVIIIISLIALLTFPNIINQIKKTKKSNNKMIEDVVIEQAKKYVSDNKDEFQGGGYCLSINSLVDKDYIKEEVVGINDYKDSKVIEIKYDESFKYKIVDQNKCCADDYCDNDGNGYTEVEYLESTGTQYIDTGYTVDNNTKFELDLLVIGCSGTCGLLGGRYSTNSGGIVVWYIASGGRGRFDYDNQQFFASLAKNVKNHILWSKDSIYINDQLIKTFDSAIFNSKSSMTIFTLKTYHANGYNTGNNTVDTRFSKYRLYCFKMWNGDTLVRDYIPVLDSSSSPCLFDKVSKECFYNQGTGEFLYG